MLETAVAEMSDSKRTHSSSSRMVANAGPSLMTRPPDSTIPPPRSMSTSSPLMVLSCPVRVEPRGVEVTSVNSLPVVERMTFRSTLLPTGRSEALGADTGRRRSRFLLRRSLLVFGSSRASRSSHPSSVDGALSLTVPSSAWSGPSTWVEKAWTRVLRGPPLNPPLPSMHRGQPSPKGPSRASESGRRGPSLHLNRPM